MHTPRFSTLEHVRLQPSRRTWGIDKSLDARSAVDEVSRRGPAERCEQLVAGALRLTSSDEVAAVLCDEASDAQRNSA